MKRFWARQIIELVAGVCGAALAAIAISAIANPRPRSLPDYLWALLARLAHLSKGDFGHSAWSGLPALRELSQNAPLTLELIGLGAIAALAVGLPLGLLFAHGPARRIAAPVLQILTAMPVFCAGLALSFGAVYLFHWTVGIAPPADVATVPEETFRHAALPVMTVGLAGAAAVQLALRRAAASAGDRPFRPGLKRLGLSTIEIEIFYVLPLIFAGLLKSAGEIVSSLIASAVVAEWVFHRPGAADLFVKSVTLADWNMTAMVIFFFASLTMIITFLGRVAGQLLAPEI